MDNPDTTAKTTPGIERAAWRMIRSIIDALSKAGESVAADALRRHERSLTKTMGQIIAKETAAPELLEACREFLGTSSVRFAFKRVGKGTDNELTHAGKMALAAIAKAAPEPEYGQKPWREPNHEPSDCGGVDDGLGTITSDADPGL